MSASLLQAYMQSHFRQFRKLCYYALTGIANTLTYFLIFNLLLSLFPTQQPLPIVGYSAVGFLFANIQSYLVNRRWTFAAERRHSGCNGDAWEQFWLYFLVSLIALIINSLCFYGLQHLLPAFSGSRLWLNAESYLAGSLGAIWCYFGYQYIVFSRSGAIQELAQDAECLHRINCSHQPQISLVIPVFNEAARIRQSLAELLAWQQRTRMRPEVIIVDDGSTDQSSCIIQEFYEQMPCLSHYRFRQNWGKGGAVRYGLSVARGEYAFFTDVDLAFPLAQLDDLRAALEQGADVAAGCRGYVYQPLHRMIISSLSHLIISWLGLTRATDTQCGLKGFTLKALRLILPQTRCTNFAFDVEMLAIAQAHDLQIAEIPVDCLCQEGSSVHLTHTLKAAFSLLQLRYQIWKSIRQEPRPGTGTSWDWAASILLFVLALGVRLPYLYDVPNFSDEWGEVLIGLKISLGQAWPLHNAAHDIGALYNYLLAGLFSLFGSSIFLPRMFVAVLSAATVVLTYWIARQWAPRLVAATAALLLAGNAIHILVTHMAWSNDITPFFTALAMLVTVIAATRCQPGWFAAAGLSWALALQTHSSVLALLPGVFLYLLGSLGWRSFFRDTRFWSAIGAFLIGYGNMIINNIIIPLDSWTWVHRKGYAFNSHPSFQLFVRDLWGMLSELGRSLASLLPNGLARWIGIAVIIILAAGLLNGMLLLRKRHGGLLLPAILVSALLLMPIFDHNFNFMVSSRYIACLFPLCFVASAIGLHDWAARLAELPIWESLLHPAWARRTGVALVAALALFLFFMLPLQSFYVYAASQVEAGKDNSAAFEAAQELASNNSAEWPVLVDGKSAQANALSQMLTMEGLTSKMIGNPGPVTAPAVLAGKIKNGIANLFNRNRAPVPVLDYSQWKRAILQQKTYAWYLLAPEDAVALTRHFHITWQNDKIIRGTAGKPAYFIGQILAYQSPPSLIENSLQKYLPVIHGNTMAIPRPQQP